MDIIAYEDEHKFDGDGEITPGLLRILVEA